MDRSRTLITLIIMVGVGAFLFRFLLGDRLNPEKRLESQRAAQEFAIQNQELLVTNQQREGVQTTASGLQYEVLASGSGSTPSRSDRVTVHYRGKLADGTEFDSSYKRGKPANFPVGGVIKGWTEALMMMKEGDKWRLVIPPELGYGSQGAGNVIPPNATLDFEVELIEVN